MSYISKNRKYVYLIILVLWISFIFFMSSKPAVESSKDSAVFVNLIMKAVKISGDKIDIVTTIIRKGGHFSEYFILSIISFVTLKKFAAGKERVFSSALLLCVSVALCDEFLQGFIDGRSSEVRDVIIDYSGALMFFILYNIGLKISAVKSRSEKKRLVE